MAEYNEELEKKRDYKVVKANELIQKNRFELSVQEQKTIAYICSMIKPITTVDRANGVPYQLEYEFDIHEYCEVCGIDYNQGKNYADIKATLKHLSDRSMWLDDGYGEVLVRWLSKVRTNKRSGIAHIKLDEDLVPYLFDLGQRFTEYQLREILGMQSAYSIRIYELMKSYEFKYEVRIDLDELKRLLMVEDVKSYSRFPDFRRYVLEIAQREINELSDINISFEPVTKGRKVVQIIFRIELKNAIERYIAGTKTNERLDKLCD